MIEDTAGNHGYIVVVFRILSAAAAATTAAK